MPFDWTNFQILAEELATKNDEASKRSAISRAYYCVFNLAFARAESTAGAFPGGGDSSHRWCWEKYQDTASSTRDPMASALWLAGDRMKRRRIKADYKDDFPRLDDNVKWTIQDAREFRTHLAALDPRYPLP